MDGRRNNGGLRNPSGGRPGWRPTETAVSLVRDYAASGMQQDHIAKAMGVSEATLKRHCARELEHGHYAYQAKVAEVAFQMAVSGDHPKMTRYWLRRFAGWR